MILYPKREGDMRFRIMESQISGTIHNIMTNGQFIKDYSTRILAGMPLEIDIIVKNGKFNRKYKPANICDVIDTHNCDYIRPSAKYTSIVNADKKRRKLEVIFERYDG